MQFGVSVLLRPQVERDRGQLVDEWFGEAVLGEVDRLHVGVAGVAALDADVRQFFGSIDRELGVIFLTASGTDNATELPLCKTETAQQAAAAAVAQRAENPERWFAIAEGTQ
jgi:hypothetical protein